MIQSSVEGLVYNGQHEVIIILDKEDEEVEGSES